MGKRTAPVEIPFCIEYGNDEDNVNMPKIHVLALRQGKIPDLPSFFFTCKLCTLSMFDSLRVIYNLARCIM